jgi:hypothetical protein
MAESLKETRRKSEKKVGERLQRKVTAQLARLDGGVWNIHCGYRAALHSGDAADIKKVER